MIFVDSDALIGLTLPQDPHHFKASQLLAKLVSTQELITSWESIDETATKLAMFHNKQVARDFLNNILPASGIRVIYLDALLSISALNIFDQQTSKNVSLTDCANMTIAKSLGITTFFSFDHHYLKNGFKLLSI